MKLFGKKGFKTIPVKQGDQIKHIPVSAEGALAGIHATRVHQLDRKNKQAFREFKSNLREAKKSIPLSQRAKVNWSKM